MTNIVVIGGGTGSFNMLSALKDIPGTQISSIVTMSDDGGSTGKLRDEYGALPPGDLRRAIVALSNKEKTQILRDIFNYRFEGGAFYGHNLGNIIMMALHDITHDFGKSINLLEELFDVKGKVYPTTFERVRILAQLENLDYVIGETNIDIPKHDPQLQIKDLFVLKDDYINAIKNILNEQQIPYNMKFNILEKFIQDKPKENPHIPEVINNADYIIIAPGDLYTSILPNILIGNIANLLKESKAQKMLFLNLFTKYGETNNYHLSDFLNVFKYFLGEDIFDYILMQDWEKHPVKEHILKHYEKENKSIIKEDITDSRVMKYDFIKQEDMIRHDSNKIKNVIEHIVCS
ncbi:gluconeogenesis factor YvcK family protein [Candidatus Absconditicoccus praedator]|uniref:gluconeogenesis factor YvcK family protein n=1 Tax=Candidatus Absconditicoccus praedator TaxID=2735562 RepID=UPI001E458344|nr:gluconeogenesis factor YvcK family protein [Candidatus Absconditicoccus praedator]UFX83020.1 YvcK family protein [Candidatus Absconditicoccus praedator]